MYDFTKDNNGGGCKPQQNYKRYNYDQEQDTIGDVKYPFCATRRCSCH